MEQDARKASARGTLVEDIHHEFIIFTCGVFKDSEPQ